MLYPNLKKALKISLICLLISLFLPLTSLAEEEDEVETPPAATEDPAAAAEVATCRGVPVIKPTYILSGDSEPSATPLSDSEIQRLWAENSTNRAAYCAQITCLNKRINSANLGLINETSAVANASEIREGLCTLTCPNNETAYYDSASDARFDQSDFGNRNCEVDTPVETCQRSRMEGTDEDGEEDPEAISVDNCNACQIRIAEAMQNNADIPEGCEQYLRIQSCSTAIVCNANGEIEISPYARVPYDTEFFDVTDRERGIQLNEQGERFDPEVAGGPIIGTVNTVINFLVRLIGILSLVVFIIGAFLMIIANGDENRLNQGKDAMKYSLLGILIVMFSYTIVVLVQSIFY